MENILQKLFTTSQFAKMHGINKRTLMYYDDIGLFQPIHVGENGYRYYNFKQYIQFESILLLRKLRIPLKDIMYYLKNYTKENLLDLLATQEEYIEENINELLWLRDIVQNKIADIKENKNIDFDKLEIVKEKAQAIIISEPFPAILNDKFIATISEFMQSCYNDKRYYGYPIGVILNPQRIRKGELKQVVNCFYKTNAKCKNKSELSYKPEGFYLVGYHAGDWKEIVETYQKIILYADKHNVTFGDFAYEERLQDDISYEKKDYFEIKISILLKS